METKCLSNPVRTIEIDEHTKKQLKADYQEEKQVIVHVLFQSEYGDKLRLWKSIFLFDAESDHKSELIHAENITFFPTWTYLRPNESICFTMVFTGLPKSCKRFHWVEIIPEPDGFKVFNIPRNREDVYHINL